MKLRTLAALGLSVAMTVSRLSGCGGSDSGDSGEDTGSEDTAQEETVEKKQIALVLPGKKDDVSFNQALYEGMMEYGRAQEGED